MILAQFDARRNTFCTEISSYIGEIRNESIDCGVDSTNDQLHFYSLVNLQERL